MEKEPTNQIPEEKTPKQILGDDFLKFRIEACKRSRPGRYAINAAFNLWIMLRILMTESGRDILKDPHLRKALLQRKYRVGLLEDSIISNDLYFPNEENTSLENITAEAGRWYAYNFHRKEQLGTANTPRRLWRAGRLATCVPSEVKDNPPDKYTPTFYIDPLDFFDFINLDIPPLSEVIDQGLIRETTYQEAYGRVGQYEKYRRFLVLADLSNKSLYQVTPKGNGLVYLMSDSGDVVKKPKEAPVLKPAYLNP